MSENDPRNVPEYKSVDAYLEYLMDDDLIKDGKVTVPRPHAAAIAWNQPVVDGIPCTVLSVVHQLISRALDLGVTLKVADVAARREVHGFNWNPNTDRYAGNPCSSGGGGASITGFATMSGYTGPDGVGQ